MSDKVNSAELLQWQNPPWILRVYFIFAVSATVIGSSVFYAPQFHKQIVPVTGWGALLLYCFTLHLAMIAMLTPGRRFQIDTCIYIMIAYGVIEFLMSAYWTRTDVENPYVNSSPWRPLITIGLPIFWLVELNSKPMRRWNERGIQHTEASAQKP